MTNSKSKKIVKIFPRVQKHNAKWLKEMRRIAPEATLIDSLVTFARRNLTVAELKKITGHVAKA